MLSLKKGLERETAVLIMQLKNEGIITTEEARAMTIEDGDAAASWGLVGGGSQN